jgi:hypothetical protein
MASWVYEGKNVDHRPILVLVVYSLLRAPPFQSPVYGEAVRFTLDLRPTLSRLVFGDAGVALSGG